MWFKNKTTGVKWEVVDKELIKRLSNDDNYEEVKKVTKKSTTKKAGTKKVEDKKEKTKKSTTKKSK